MSEQGKRCGTCEHWSAEADAFTGNLRQCGWTTDVPFWATIGNGDHGDWTAAKDGKHCPAWIPKEKP